MSKLAERSCIPCKGGVPPLVPQQIAILLTELDGWVAERDHHLSKVYKFANFVDALGFTNRIGAVAEEQNHHPDIHLGWGKVHVEIWTHKIDGLTESDFVLAAKFDQVLPG